MSEGKNGDALIKLCRSCIKPLPVRAVCAKGFLTTIFESKSCYVMHLLAEEYDVDIDRELDRIRAHRSRVNIITSAVPLGTDGRIVVESKLPVRVYAPFCGDAASVERGGDLYTITLPENCAYAILRFAKE